jgi:hypothetical protein
MKLNELRQIIRFHINERSKTRSNVHRVFDFDDTLVFTDSKVHIKSKDGKHKKSITPAEYAIYKKDNHDDEEFDYSDFKTVINPRNIKWTIDILKNTIAKRGASSVTILTARSSEAEPAIRKFLESQGISGIEIVGLGDSDPLKKAEWISDKITRDNLKELDFFDDSHKNIDATRLLKNIHPECRINVRHIVHKKH